MTHYHCNQCDMSVKDITCAKCDAKLVHDTIDVDGNTIHVSKCPNDCGMIKSPQCCGHDMDASDA